MDANVVNQGEGITQILTNLFINPNAILAIVFIGAFTAAFKRLSEKYLGWENKKLYIVLLPMVPEMIGMILALIPGTLPEMLQNSSIFVKLGFGIAGGAFSSKAWKIVVTFGEKPEPPSTTVTTATTTTDPVPAVVTTTVKTEPVVPPQEPLGPPP